MQTPIRNLAYFVPRMGGYGFLAGALFGALIYPGFGAFIGAPLGLTAGILLGIIFGIGITFYNIAALQDAADVDEYASRLAMGTGLIATVLSALPLAFIFAPVAGFTTAYVANRYAYEASPLAQKRKNDHFGAEDRHRRSGVVRQLTREILMKSVYVSGLAAVIFFLLGAAQSIFVAMSFFIFSLIWGTAFAGIIGLVNGFFITFLNQLIFEPELSKEAYQRRVVAIVSVLTLFLSSIVTLGIGAPFAAFAAGAAARKYTDWYYDAPEKEKRQKLKNSGRLALYDDHLIEEEDWFSNDEKEQTGELSRLL